MTKNSEEVKTSEAQEQNDFALVLSNQACRQSHDAQGIERRELQTNMADL